MDELISRRLSREVAVVEPGTTKSLGIIGKSVQTHLAPRTLNFPAIASSHPIWQVPTPSLILSPRKAAQNFKAIQRAFPFASVGYAMKSNPHPSLLSALSEIKGSMFEVASKAEIEALLRLGIAGNRIFFSNPIKQQSHIQFAINHGINLFVYDSECEVDKMAQAAQGQQLEVYVRMTVPHEGALWPLTHKFGVESRRAVELMRYARQRGLKPVGLAFHVGSQCTRPDTWGDALESIAPAWKMAREQGFDLDFIDIGGGFPARYTGPIPGPMDVAAVVKPMLERCVPGFKRVFLEPGRGVCGDAGDMVLEVTGVADRPDGQKWLYLNGGFFSGLYEIPDGIRPAVMPVLKTPRPINMTTYRLAGPTCDSLDTLFEMRSPVEIRMGDRLVLKCAGAYVYNVSSPFNGFDVPVVLNEDEWLLKIDQFKGIC